MAATLIETKMKEQNPDQQLRNFFSLNLLNRASEKRKDKQWMESKISDNTSKYLLLSDLKPFVLPIKDKSSKWRYRLCWLEHKQISSHLSADPVIIFLGIDQTSSNALFAVDVSGVEDTKFSDSAPDASFLVPFPGSLQMEPSDAGIFAEARTMMDWLKRYQFCGTCGSQTDITEGGHKRSCRNKDCISSKGILNFNTLFLMVQTLSCIKFRTYGMAWYGMQFMFDLFAFLCCLNSLVILYIPYTYMSKVILEL
jgi:NAD+ diphosphatase